MTGFHTRPLSSETWPAYARLIEAHNGVWGGCWCMAFHAKGEGWGNSAEANRAEKKQLVRAGHALAALVFDGDDCVGWCQYGPPAELPRIRNQRAYLASGPARADWRITCFFAAKGYRGRGVADTALAGAVSQIAEAGGGYVEGFPEDTEGRTATRAFLFNGTMSSFLRQGFERKHQIGKHKWLVARQVAPA